MATFNITNNVPKETQIELLQRGMEQSSSEIFRIAMDLLIDPDTLTADWTPNDAGINENNSSLLASAELLQFHLKRYFSAKNKLESF
jgi:hypothetical protein